LSGEQDAGLRTAVTGGKYLGGFAGICRDLFIEGGVPEAHVYWKSKRNFLDFSELYNVGHMCEISPVGVSKWSGVQHLAQDWGIGPDEICAVGDDVNDIPMIRGAGLGVAMGNALDEVKAAADRIAPCHDSDGLVEVVKWILE
jgi:hydroxymethylpyrimidine pyrophosphatase-like HAD family hydrolase